MNTHTLSFRARRLAQTPRIARNHPKVLLDLLASRSPWGPSELVYRLRNGLTVECPNLPGARVPVYELFAEDDYRLPWFTDGLGQDTTAIDIGAHIGCFTLDFTRLLPGSRVIAFEASPATYEFLRRNVERNHLTDRVESHRLAVWDGSGTLRFADTGAGSGHNGVLHLGAAGSTTIEVPSIPMTEAFSLAGGAVDLVKMDAEGAEYAIVLGSSTQDWAGVRRVVMEYHALAGHDFAELEAFFTAAGLQLAHHEPFRTGLGMAWFSRDPLGPRPH